MPMRILLLLVVLLGGCATHQERVPPASVSSTAAVAGLSLAPTTPTSQLATARTQVAQKRYSDADATLRHLLGSKDFHLLSGTEQHAAVALGGAVAVQLHDAPRALGLLQWACSMDDNTPDDWVLRVLAANAAADPKDAAVALTVVARRSPQDLRKLEELRQLHQAMQGLEADDDRYVVLGALFNVGFRNQPEGASEWWRDLALLQLGHGKPDEAGATIVRITSPYVAISVDADNRFAPLKKLDVTEVNRRATDEAVTQTQRATKRLQPELHLADLLIAAQRDRDVLQVMDGLIDFRDSKADYPGSGLFDDYDRAWPAVLETRAWALYNLTRWDAAVAQMDAASRLPEGGAPNITQVLQLAGMQEELGRADEALATLGRLDQGALTPFGRMAYQGVTAAIAVQRHDAAALSGALKYMQAHQADAVSDYQEALLAAADDAGGAKLLISRLQNLRQRSDALVAVQDYLEGTWPPLLKERRHRWEALLARRDVQAAIKRVGVVNRYPLVLYDY